MSKEEFLKIQTCVLKVNIHCDGCKQKVKKILQKIDGVYKTNIDSELGKVTISGNVDPETLIKKLAKSGKKAEIWGAPKANNHQQNQLNNQFKNLQIDSGKGGKNKGQGGGGGGQKGGGGNNQQQPKGAPIGQVMNPMQLEQLKALQDKLPHLKDFKMPLPMPFGNNNKDQNNQKAVKFSMPEDDDLTDSEFDEYYEDEDYLDDDEIDDEMDDAPLNKMKPIMGNPQGMPIMMNNMMNGQNPQLMKGGNNGGGNGKNGGGGGGGGGNIPVQMNPGGGGNNGGKKGGNGNNNHNQGGGAAQKGGKNGGGGGGGGQTQNKNGNNGHGGGGNPNINANGAKKGNGMNDGLNGMPNIMAMNAAAGRNVGPPTGSMPMGQMGQMGNVLMGQMSQMGQLGNVSAVQGLPASAINGANGGGGGYFQGAGGPEMMAGNPNYQQQLAAVMMNQQRANGNERFQPMMYARPPPAVNYWPPQPYSYPYHAPPPPGEHYTEAFNDESTPSCSIM